MKIEYVILSEQEAFDDDAMRPRVRIRLKDMSLERKKYLFQELGVNDDFILSELLRSIEKTLQLFNYHNYLLVNFNSLTVSYSGPLKKIFVDIHSHLHSAHLLMLKLDERNLETLVPEDPIYDADGELDIQTFRYDVGAVSRAAHELADSIKPGRGRTPRDDLFEALIDLGGMYKEYAGKKPGYSSQPIKKSCADEVEMHGPFVRFVHRVLQIVEPSPSAINGAIRRFVDESNRRARRRAAISD